MCAPSFPVLSPRSLKKLVVEVLRRHIQVGEHNSVEDARATLDLYKHMRVVWEKDLYDKQTKRAHATAATAAKKPAADGEEEADQTMDGTVAPRPASKKSTKKPSPTEVKQEAREVRNIERNQRRKKMRKEQKEEKRNR